MKSRPSLEEVPAAHLQCAFNEAIDYVRLLAIVSPTCPGCIRGYEVLRTLFHRVKDENLRGFIVWISMLAADDAVAARKLSGRLEDERVSMRGWDAEREIGQLFGEMLELKIPAWDVYLVYEPGVAWKAALPPKPTFWRHQLDARSGADQQFCLRPAEFSSELSHVLHSSSSRRP